jgi:hypothetical protein
MYIIYIGFYVWDAVRREWRGPADVAEAARTSRKIQRGKKASLALSRSLAPSLSLSPSLPPSLPPSLSLYPLSLPPPLASLPLPLPLSLICMLLSHFLLTHPPTQARTQTLPALPLPLARTLTLTHAPLLTPISTSAQPHGSGRRRRARFRRDRGTAFRSPAAQVYEKGVLSLDFLKKEEKNINMLCVCVCVCIYIYNLKTKSLTLKKQKILPIFLLLVHLQRIQASPLCFLSHTHFSPFSLSLFSSLFISLLFSLYHSSHTSTRRPRVTASRLGLLLFFFTECCDYALSGASKAAHPSLGRRVARCSVRVRVRVRVCMPDIYIFICVQLHDFRLLFSTA